MTRATGLLVSIVAGALAAHVACGSDSEPGTNLPSFPANDAAVGVGDASVDAAVDPRCATQAVPLGLHPHATAQDTQLGQTLSDARGWYGRLYFAYGDFEANTGPIHISSYDPKTKSWTDHAVSYKEVGTGNIKSTAEFRTHDIQRFVPIGDTLWATAWQPDFRAPFDPDTAPEYAVGSANHQWTQVDIAPRTLHIAGAIERAPGDMYVTGSAKMITDASVNANGRAGSFIWRSQNGGPFVQLFPDFTPQAGGGEAFDLTGAWAFGAALNGVAYFNVAGFIYKFDGTSWGYGASFGDFSMPVTFAGHLVFATLGQLYAFDETTRKNLDFRFFESKGRYNALFEQLALFQVTEGRLLAASYGGDVMMTTDLTNWSCIGKVPADATSITSLDGVIYFGGIEGRVYGFTSPSW